MRNSYVGSACAIAVLGLATLCAAPAFAGEASDVGPSGIDVRLARVEQQLAHQSAPSTRETQSAVDAYLASSTPGTCDASLVGGCGSAGYDGGFWIRGGSFLLKINLTIQARYEYFDWDEDADEPSPGGDLSGYSLPRVTLKFSGDATCDIHYYAEFEFGHHGFPNGQIVAKAAPLTAGDSGPISNFQGAEAREAWIEYEAAPAFAWRMGLIKTATTRQLMTAPEHQQFVDISMASAVAGAIVPGFSDRNRDYGVMIHGVLGCDGEWSYLVTATNGDGPIRRNIWDTNTDDNLAYSARLNWDFAGHPGYEEGALNNNQCQWTGAVGAWVYLYDPRRDKPHTILTDITVYGADLALGYGSWSLTAAYTAATQRNGPPNSEADAWSWFVQVGYLFCGTAWELAVRYGSYSVEAINGGPTFGATEWGAAVNYYIDGHADKLTADVAMISSNDDGNLLTSIYPGYHATLGDGMLVRFQWQLAL